MEETGCEVVCGAPTTFPVEVKVQGKDYDSKCVVHGVLAGYLGTKTTMFGFWPGTWAQKPLRLGSGALFTFRVRHFWLKRCIWFERATFGSDTLPRADVHVVGTMRFAFLT